MFGGRGIFPIKTSERKRIKMSGVGRKKANGYITSPRITLSLWVVQGSHKSEVGTSLSHSSPWGPPLSASPFLHSHINTPAHPSYNQITSQRNPIPPASKKLDTLIEIKIQTLCAPVYSRQKLEYLSKC